MHLPLSKLVRGIPVAIAVTFMVPVALPTVVEAQSVDQQRQKVEDIVDELERLEEQARILGEDYNEAIASKAELDVEITDAEARIAVQEAELGELRSNLADMALRSFVGAGSVPLGPLFEDSDNINDAVKRDELARVALSAGDATTDELDALVSDINDEKAELDNKRERAEQLAASLTSAQAETEDLTAQYTTARADAEARLGVLIQQEEARRAAESQRRMQEEAAAAARAASASNNTNRSNSNSNSSNSNSGGGNSNTNSGGGSSNAGNSGGGNSGGSAPSSAAPAPSPAPSAPAPSSRAGIAVQAALGQQGVPYGFGTSKPGVSFDCSGLTSYAWAQAGVGIPRNSRAQYAGLPRVAKDQAQPGDLLFFYSPISHVSLYLGGGMQVHAPNTGTVVHTRAVNWGSVVGVGRPG